MFTKSHSFAIGHIMTAGYFAKRAEELEQSPSEPMRVLASVHRAYVAPAVMLSVAFLEAAINEVLEDAEGGFTSLCGKIRALPHGPDLGTLSASKYVDIDRGRLLDRWQLVLETLRLPVLASGDALFNNATLLVRLRNRLVHARPAVSRDVGTSSARSASHGDLETQLRGRFPPNPRAGAGDADFPDRLLSAGCAAWAVHAAVALADAFFGRIGIKPPYDHVRSELPPAS